MGDNTSIEWTRGTDGSKGATWNPLAAFITDPAGTYTFDDAPGLKWRRGWFCVHASEGCRNCYAEKMNLWRGNGLAYKAQNLPLVRFEFVGLDQPIRWTRPRMIFPCSMTDLFADFYTTEQIDKVFEVMFKAKHHTFQILTKRAERMYDYISSNCWLTNDPLPNVWFGVSVENQKAADERISFLLKTPAAVRWLSVEPLLGPVDLCTAGMKINGKLNVHTGERVFIDWVVVGGESGPCARPMHPAWARQIKDDCRICGVPFFFKQWGEFLPSLRGACMHPSSEGAQGPARLLDRVDIWKCGLCGMLHDHDFDFVKVGKKEAGRLLDGVEWSQYPA